MVSTQREKIIYIVPYSHMDYSWGYYWGPFLNNILKRDTEVIIEILKLMERDRNYVCSSIHCAHPILHFLINYPEWQDKFLKRVKEGRIEIGDSLSDPGISPGVGTMDNESIIRNIIYGRRFWKSLLGEKHKSPVFQMPDVPGHHGQIPQILRKLGFKYYKFDRPYKVLNEKGVPLEFVWKGIDGTEILCQRSPLMDFFPKDREEKLSRSSDAFFRQSCENLLKKIQNLQKVSKMDFILLYQGGDWALPRPELTKFIERWNMKNLKPKLQISTLKDYFFDLEKYPKLPKIEGTLDPIGWTGPAGVGGQVRDILQNKVVNSLLTAEKIASINFMLNGVYPEKELTRLWEKVLLYEDHGCIYYLYPEDDKERTTTLKEVISKCEDIAKISLRTISSQIKIKKEGFPIIVFNLLPWKREGITKCIFYFSPFERIKEFEIYSKEGEKIASQIVNFKKYPAGSYKYLEVIFLAKIPPLGYRVYYFKKVQKREEEISLSYKEYFNNIILENEIYKIRIGPTGQILSLYDKKNEKEILSSPFGNDILCDKGEVGYFALSANFPNTQGSGGYPYTFKEIKYGPLMIHFKIEAPTFGAERIQEISLFSHSRLITFKTTLKSKRENVRYRAMFPLNLKEEETELWHNIPFAAEKLDLEKEPYVGERFQGEEKLAETPQGLKGLFLSLNWADLSDESYGASLILDGWHTFMKEGNSLSTVLLTTMSAEKLGRFWRCKHFLGTKGDYKFTYYLYPHSGNHEKAKTSRVALEIKNPLISLPIEKENGNLLSEEESFLSIDPENILLSAIYVEEGKVNVRLYETEGRETKAKIRFRFPFTIEEVDLSGEKAKILSEWARETETYFSAYEIKTLRLSSLKRRGKSKIME